MPQPASSTEAPSGRLSRSNIFCSILRREGVIGNGNHVSLSLLDPVSARQISGGTGKRKIRQRSPISRDYTRIIRQGVLYQAKNIQ